MAKETEKEAAAFLKKKVYKNKQGKEDYFWVGHFFHAGEKIDVTTSGRILPAKDGKAETLIVNFKTGGKNSNVL